MLPVANQDPNPVSRDQPHVLKCGLGPFAKCNEKGGMGIGLSAFVMATESDPTRLTAARAVVCGR